MSSPCFEITTFFAPEKKLARRVPLMEQELLTLPEHLISHPVFSGVRVARSLLLCVMLSISLIALNLLTIVLSGFLRFTYSDYPFCIFKFVLQQIVILVIVGFP